MNEQVKQLIEKKIAEQENAKLALEQSKKARRTQHLIALGLHSAEKETVWTNLRVSQSQYYDPGKNMFYSYDYKPIELTDEEYDELCKFYPENEVSSQNEDADKKTATESTLKTVAAIVLGLGIAFCLILVIVSFVLDMNIVALLAIPFLLSILSTWALYRCITHMSYTLRQIDHKLKDAVHCQA